MISLSKLIVREKADSRDGTGIYLICQSKQSPEMYELVCRSLDDRRAWTATLKDAIAKCCQQGYFTYTSDTDIAIIKDALFYFLSVFCYSTSPPPKFPLASPPCKQA